jgi:small subunit ribosomal protein S21
VRGFPERLSALRRAIDHRLDRHGPNSQTSQHRLDAAVERLELGERFVLPLREFLQQLAGGGAIDRRTGGRHKHLNRSEGRWPSRGRRTERSTAVSIDRGGRAAALFVAKSVSRRLGKTDKAGKLCGGPSKGASEFGGVVVVRNGRTLVRYAACIAPPPVLGEGDRPCCPGRPHSRPGGPSRFPAEGPQCGRGGEVSTLDVKRLKKCALGGSMVKLVVRDRETIQEAVRRFRKLVERSGIKKEMRRREYYEKPSETRRRARLRAERRSRNTRRLINR